MNPEPRPAAPEAGHPDVAALLAEVRALRQDGRPTAAEHDRLRARLLDLIVLLSEVRSAIGLPLVPPHAIHESVLSALRETLAAKDSIIHSLSERVAGQSEALSRQPELPAYHGGTRGVFDDPAAHQ